MKRLLYIEWQKLYNYRLARIFLIIYFLLLLGVSIGLYQEFSLFGKEIRLKDQGFYSFPLVYNFLTYANSFLKIFLAFIIISTVVSEFTNRTFKQNLIDGLTRKEWLISKLAMIFLLCLFSTFVVGILCAFFGWVNPSKPPVGMGVQMEFLIFYFLENFAFLVFAFFISVILRKAIFAFLFLFVWKFIEPVIMVILNFALKGGDKTNVKKIIEFLPLDVQSNMITNPVRRTEFAKSLNIGLEYQFPTISLILTIVYTLLFIYLTYRIIMKKDW